MKDWGSRRRSHRIKLDAKQLCVFDCPLMNVEHIPRACFRVHPISELSANGKHQTTRTRARLKYGDLMTCLRQFISSRQSRETSTDHDDFLRTLGPRNLRFSFESIPSEERYAARG